MAEPTVTRSGNRGTVEVSRSLRVLFVDDERALQELMKSELPRLGHEVTVCPDGRAALKALEKATFDAAILDLRMPGMTGIEVLEQLKKASPDTEAVMMTGHASMETAIEAMRLGAFDYITKPCKLAEIEGMLRCITDRRELKLQESGLADAASRPPRDPLSSSASPDRCRRSRACCRCWRRRSRRSSSSARPAPARSWQRGRCGSRACARTCPSCRSTAVP